MPFQIKKQRMASLGHMRRMTLEPYRKRFYLPRDYLVSSRGQGRFNDGNDDLLVENGDRLKLSIDIKLQQYIEKLLKGKVGSVVAIEPKSG